MRARIKTLNQSLDRLEQQDAYFGLTTEEYWCGSKDSYLGLTCTEYWCVDFYWSLLHWLPEEVEEREQLEARDDALWGMYYEARKKNGPYAGWPDEKNNKAELLRIGKRLTEMYDTVRRRVYRNVAMRNRVWSQLAPKVLRYADLDGPRFLPYLARPRGYKRELSKAEREEVKELETWFDKLQTEILGSVRS